MICKKLYIVFFVLTGLCHFQQLSAQKTVKPLPLFVTKQGKLAYTPDSLGNRIPDFSFCGYRAGEASIPEVAIRVVVPVISGDATLRIQAAIDYVGKLPADKNGFRGVVLLQKGTYSVEGSLVINISGVILRGSGAGDDGTVIIGAGKDRSTLVRMEGINNKIKSFPVEISDDYVPVNSTAIHCAAAADFKVGGSIMITRPSTKEWIETLGTNHFGGGLTTLGWKPDQRNIEWMRTITAVNGNLISFDAPITTALDKKYGSSTVAAYSWPGELNYCGVENLQLVSSFNQNRPKDEDHRWMAITIDHARDVWVRQVGFKNFAGTAVAVYGGASRVTVEDCISRHPVSEIGGERRNTFFTAGQQVLFQRCYAEFGMHDFSTGFCAPGPNAFVQCESKQPFGFSGGLDSWSAGVLFDLVNVDGNAISFMNRGQDGQGAGWTTANSVLWNCSAARIDCFAPPTAQNWAFGSWSQFSGNGYWGESNNSIDPRSLYEAQLRERMGVRADARPRVMPVETNASSSPSVETALALTQQAVSPAKTVIGFIADAAVYEPVPTNAAGIKTIDEIGIPQIIPAIKAPPLKIKGGWMVRGDGILTGNRLSVPWWNGSARPYAVANMGSAITRFVPGKTAKGLTDNLGELSDTMLQKNIIAMDQNYGLWYDRRRDDHERIRRMDGDVWAPFYELPFARSGNETAWDGLSKYDLTTYNYWYWNRLKQFADLADQKGLLLIHQNYFQHNIIEAGAHYADFPWRTANNINGVGFPEPVPYAGDKRIFMADQFYDTAHPARRNLHKKYIRQCLENFSENSGVIQMIGEEFTGPLHFVQFWLNTILEWENETGKHPVIGLSTTKDVQDSILANPKYADVINVIDIKYWHYQANEKLYAPKGGLSLAPRQHARLLNPKSSSPQQVYRAVLEYRLKFPDKAVLYSADSWDRNGIAVMMAGGSLPNLRIKDGALLRAISGMRPVQKSTSQWMLFDEKNGYVIADEKDSFSVDLLSDTGRFDVRWINIANGTVVVTKLIMKGGKINDVKKPETGNWLLWLKKK